MQRNKDDVNEDEIMYTSCIAADHGQLYQHFCYDIVDSLYLPRKREIEK